MKTNNETYNIIATEHDGLNTRSMSIQIEALQPNLDIRQAVINACTEYVQTPEGKSIYEYNCHCFNWADFVSNVPNSLCEKHGFRRLNDHVSDIEVDWDEHLVNDSALEIDT
jgi:hypothetical protein